MEKDDARWKNSFFSKAVMPNAFEPDNSYEVSPGYYGVPIDITNIQMLYNKKIFEKSGLDPASPPVSWDEFIEYSRKIKAAGFEVFVSGFGETWLIESFALNYAVNIMGLEKVMDTFKGKVL